MHVLEHARLYSSLTFLKILRDVVRLCPWVTRSANVLILYHSPFQRFLDTTVGLGLGARCPMAFRE